MKREDFETLKRTLEDLITAKAGEGTVIAAIDGRCGSGKSTVAAALSDAFEDRCNVVHMDDFYLPMDQRPENWREIPSANMDLQRFLREVLVPVREGRETVYVINRLHEGTTEECRIPRRPLLLVEGSYSQHTLLAGMYDLKVFLDCPPQEQERRVRERAPERFENFQRLWIPLELGYHRECRVREQADLIIDASGPFCPE